MTLSALPRDTVVIDEAVHDVYKQLTEGCDPVAAPFRTMKDIFVWAAILGYRKGEFKSFENSKRVTIFRWSQFAPQIDLPLLKAIAIAHTGGVEVLANQEQMLCIAEEYANIGIHELRAQLLQETAQPLWNLIAVVPMEP